MSKIWFCRSCGYEVPARGRCHACGNRLERSPLGGFPAAAEEDEVGYNLDHWDGPGRGRLIVALIEAGIEHRFEEEDLVVATDDEERTDDLVAGLLADVGEEGTSDPDAPDEVPAPNGAEDAVLLAEVELLRSAAHRLRLEPTDMHADGDVAQASAAVFAAPDFYAADPETWAAVGRVTRRLLAALGADEALDDEIRAHTAILAKLLDPVFAGNQTAGGGPAPAVLGDTGAAALGGEPAAGGSDGSSSTETVYELPEWLPEQRAELSLLLEEQRIPHRWQVGDLVVPAAREADAEALFDRVEGAPREDDDDADGEARYRALEELFAAADRFVNDPKNASRAADVVRAVTEADGPTPVGLDDAQWWTIVTRARTLADTLEHGGNPEVAFGEATTLRDLLRAVV